MTKDEGQHLLLQGAALYLFALAVIALPKLVEAILNIGFLLQSGIWFEPEGIGAKVKTMSQGQLLATSLGTILRIVAYVLVARNLYSGGSWFTKLMEKGKKQNINLNPISGSSPEKG